MNSSFLSRVMNRPALRIVQTLLSKRTVFGAVPAQKPRVLVTGAGGQIGTELVPYLRSRYGTDNVIASDIKSPNTGRGDGPFLYLDTCDYNSLARICVEHQIDWVFHMAALLSATGEKDPQLAIKINNSGVENTLEVARINNLRIYIPSSIAVFHRH
eukprot:876189_1